MDIHESARKHGITTEDIVHAVEHALAVLQISDGETPVRLLHIGPAAAGQFLEIVTLEFDDGRSMAIHAMRMRAKYRHYLSGGER